MDENESPELPFEIRPVEGNREPVRKVWMDAEDAGDEDAMEHVEAFGPDPYVQHEAVNQEESYESFRRRTSILPHVSVKVEGIPDPEKMRDVSEAIKKAIDLVISGKYSADTTYGLIEEHSYTDEPSDEDNADSRHHADVRLHASMEEALSREVMKDRERQQEKPSAEESRRDALQNLTDTILSGLRWYAEETGKTAHSDWLIPIIQNAVKTVEAEDMYLTMAADYDVRFGK